jgi:hypothetical protein
VTASTTSTTAAAPSSTTTSSVLVPTSTTTTLPSGCLVEATFDSVGCRLRWLSDAATETSDLQPIRDRLGRQLGRAQLLLGGAQARCVAAKRGPAKRKLLRVGRQLAGVLKALRPGRTRSAAVLSLSDATALLRGDSRTLARSLACP